MATREDDFDVSEVLLALVAAAIAVQLWRFSRSTPAFIFQNASPGRLNSLLAAIPMQVSPAGRAFIQSQERFSLNEYPDAGGRAIYWGHQVQPGEIYLHTIADGEQYFNRDIASVEGAINGAVKVALSQDQFDALADLAYDIGVTAFKNSTLVRMLNQGNYQGAAQQILRWNHSQGRVNSVLTQRRQAEQQKFSGAG